MSRSWKASFLGCAALTLGLACGPRIPVTNWYYSSWYLESGGGSMGTFKAARSSCLEQAGIDDPADVSPGGSQEVGFIECMNKAGWCTSAYHCDKPGAS